MSGPVVQVVTVGADWTAIVAAISGGVVGLAGIGATIWVALRNLGAEDKRARRMEKRQAYADFLAAFHEAIRVAYMEPAPGPQSDIAHGVVIGMFTALNQIKLIGTNEIGVLAGDLFTCSQRLVKYRANDASKIKEDIPRIGTLNRSLLNAMRRDLGEPVWDGPELPPVERAREPVAQTNGEQQH